MTVMVVKITFVTVFILFFLTNTLQEKIFAKKGFNPAGKVPVGKGLFAIGKFSVLLTWSGAVLQAFGVHLRMIILPECMYVAAAVLFFAGFVMSEIAHLSLAEANVPVLPDQQTALMTRGIYRFSRNPSYLGIFVMNLACIMYTANIVILILGITGIVIHHRIILKEEEFLKTRFGTVYDAYCSKTRRYI